MEDNDKDIASAQIVAEGVKYGDNPDVTFFFPKNGGAIVNAEKYRLAKISEIFRKQLSPTNVEYETGEVIEITDISFEIFSIVIQIIYGGDIDINEENYRELLYMGIKYLLYDLTHKVVNFVLAFVNEDNLWDHFEFIDKLNIPSLSDHMKRICLSYPLEVIHGLTRSVPHKKILQIILESPCLRCTDFAIYEAIVRTFSNNLDDDIFDVPKYMREELGKLIYLIRFPTMTKMEIIKCAQFPSLLTDEQVVDFLLWKTQKKFSNTLQFFSSQPRILYFLDD